MDSIPVSLQVWTCMDVWLPNEAMEVVMMDDDLVEAELRLMMAVETYHMERELLLRSYEQFSKKHREPLLWESEDKKSH